MGLRKDALKAIISALDGLRVADIVPDANGRSISVVDTLFDPADISLKGLPKFSCVPAPETIQVGLYGYTMDSTYRIVLVGYCTHDAAEGLFDSSEDVIEAIVHTLTNETIVNGFLAKKFSVIEIGPIINEQWDDIGNLAYITLPLAIQFLEHPDT